MTKTPRRPRDLNQWAKRMVDIATMDEAERAVVETKAKKKKSDESRAHTPGRRGSSSS